MAFTLVQANSNLPAAGTLSLSQAYASNVTPNDTLVLLVVLAGATGTFGAVSDSRGNTWTQIPGFPFQTAVLNTTVSAWTAPSGAAAAGADTVSIGVCSTDIKDFLIAEFTGLGVADGNGQSGTGSSATVNTPAFTPTAAGDLVINFERVANAITTFNSPWTVIGAVFGDGNGWCYQASASSGTQTPNATQSPGGSWAGVTFGLKVPGAGPVAITATALATAQSAATVRTVAPLSAQAFATAQSAATVRTGIPLSAQAFATAQASAVVTPGRIPTPVLVSLTWPFTGMAVIATPTTAQPVISATVSMPVVTALGPQGQTAH